MPQYGAQGFATHGKGYRWILGHYYTGTWAAKASKRTVRVLLEEGRTSVTVRSSTRWVVEDGRGRSWMLSPGSRTVGRDLRVRAGAKVRKLSPPVTFSRTNGGPMTVDGSLYRGEIVLRKQDGTLLLLNHVGLQPYLQGVVPGEMPADWHPEALKVQAVAARSYALASIVPGGKFDVYDDTRDQVYGGVAWEKPSTNAAVRATANEVRHWSGGLATTFFYSSSGGRTASNEDVWPGGSPLPYLRSVPDPYDSISPHHTWGPFRYSRNALDAKLGAHVIGRLRDIVVDVNASRRADSIRITGSGGKTSMEGWLVREVLGLKSSWLRVGVLDLRAERGTIKRGENVELRGLARAVGAARLERRLPGAEWKRSKDLALTKASRFVTSAGPRLTGWFRVGSRKGKGNAVLVRVATKVRFFKPDDRNSLAGFVRPAAAGIKIEIQRRTGGSWTEVAQGTTDASGRFDVALEVADGVYRARADAPGTELGTSPRLTVTS